MSPEGRSAATEASLAEEVPLPEQATKRREEFRGAATELVVRDVQNPPTFGGEGAQPYSVVRPRASTGVPPVTVRFDPHALLDVGEVEKGGAVREADDVLRPRSRKTISGEYLQKHRFEHGVGRTCVGLPRRDEASQCCAASTAFRRL